LVVDGLMDSETPPDVPTGWDCKFSENRQRWYFFDMADPKTTSWKLPPPAADVDVELDELLSNLTLASGAAAASPRPGQKSEAGQEPTAAGSGSRRLIIVRHAYRLDEADLSWPNKALRPQDSPLAHVGLRQAALLGEWLAARESTATEPIALVLASPFARTVQTAAAVALALRQQKVDDGSGLSLAVEQGLCEEAAHMARNKLCTEPFFLPAADLCVAAAAAGGLDLTYRTLVPVRLERGER
jgi:hypothetical protein